MQGNTCLLFETITNEKDAVKGENSSKRNVVRTAVYAAILAATAILCISTGAVDLAKLKTNVAVDMASIARLVLMTFGVLLEGGNSMFVGNAEGYIRLNLAMPRSIIKTGLDRMTDAIEKHNSK